MIRLRHSLGGLALAVATLGLAATPARASAPVPTRAPAGDIDNVVVVLDASGSMKEPMIGDPRTMKMDAAREAIREVLATVPPTTHVGLLVFSGKNVPNDWVFPLGPREDEVLEAGLAKIMPDGNTPLGAYIKKGADRLLERRADQSGYGSYRLLVVTDGEANDQRLVDRYVPEVLGRGLVVDVIGVSMAQDHILAKRVHSYRRADDPGSLQQAISEVFAEVSDRQVSDVAESGFELIADLPDDVVPAIVESLTKFDNQPIGSRPTRGKRPAQADGGDAGPSGPSRAAKAARTFLTALGTACFFGFAFLVLAVVAWSRRKGKRRGRRRRDD